MALLFELKQKLAQGFQAFWVRWPRKVARLEAEKAYRTVVTPEDEPEIHKALDWQIPIFEQREPEHIPHAATWIRGRRWEDEKPAPKPPTPNRPIGRPETTAQITQQEAIAQIERLIRSGMSPDDAKRQVYRELGWIKEGPS